MILLRIFVSAYAVIMACAAALSGYFLFELIFSPPVNRHYELGMYGWLVWICVLVPIGWLLLVAPLVTVLRKRMQFVFNRERSLLYGAIGGLLAFVVAGCISIIGIAGLFMVPPYYFAIVIGAVSLTIYNYYEADWQQHGEPGNKLLFIAVLLLHLVGLMLLARIFYHFFPNPRWYF